MFKYAVSKVVTVVIAVTMLCTAAVAVADSELKFSGELRSRLELDKKGFSPNRSLHEFTDLRTRLGLEAIHEGDTHIFIQLQDSRRLGTRGASGTLSSTENVDLHQAYLLLDNLFGGNWGLQAGRFEVNLGNQRVFGSVGWHNVGRSWEGLNAWYTNNAVKMTGYWLKKTEQLNPIENDDFDIYGINAIIKDAGLELLAFYEFDASEYFNLFTPSTNINFLDRINIGCYLHRTIDNAYLTANGVFQFGDQAHVLPDTVTEQDISAFLITAEIGYAFQSDLDPAVAVGIDYSSGDDEPGNDTYNAYNNLYYTGHKFRGFMDYFLNSDSYGLVDLIAKGSLAPAAGWKIGGAFHYFQTAAEYTDFEDTRTSAVGAEIDLTVSTTRIAGVKVSGGFSVFLPDDSYTGLPDSDPGVWGYLMLAGNFGGE